MSFVDRFMKENFPDPSAFVEEKISRHRGINVNRNSSFEDGIKLIRSNTTILSIKYGEDAGTILAADRRTSSGGHEIWSDDTEKITPLTPFSAVAFCGAVHVSSDLEEAMLTAFDSYTSRYGSLSIDGQAKYLGRLLKQNFYYVQMFGFWGDLAIPILAGYDPGFRCARIFIYDSAGQMYEKKEFAGDGCGWPVIDGLILEKWKRTMTADEAIALSAKAMFISGIKSHGVSDSRISPPTILKIDISGVNEVEEEKVKELIRLEAESYEDRRKRQEKVNE